jgi:hypothetical protein
MLLFLSVCLECVSEGEVKLKENFSPRIYKSIHEDNIQLLYSLLGISNVTLTFASPCIIIRFK